MKNLRLILYQNKKPFDLSETVESITWKGRKGSASRSLSASLVDVEKLDINPANGDSVVFYEGSTELFRGLVMSCQRSDGRKVAVTAYDNGIYLSNNKDTFVYENKTLHDIFLDVCKRFGLKYGSIARTKYKIPDLIKQRTTIWDVIQDAVSQDYKATGTKYYVSSQKGILSLIKRKENIKQYVFSADENIFSYNYKFSTEKINTRIKVLTKDDTVYTVEKNAELEKKIGIFQEVERKDDDLSEAKLREQISENLKQKSTPEESLTINTIGLSDVVSGVGVWVEIERLDIKRTYWVDEDTHTFKGDSHTMSLKLNRNNEV